MTLNSVEKMAVSKVLKSKDVKIARDELLPGKYEVNTMVMISGHLAVGEDTEKTSTCSLLNEEFLSLVLHHCGVTRAKAASVIKDVASEYMKDWTGSKEDKKASNAARKERVAEFDPEGKISSIFEEVKASVPKTRVRGSVKFSGEISKIQPMEITLVEEEDKKSA